MTSWPLVHFVSHRVNSNSLHTSLSPSLQRISLTKSSLDKTLQEYVLLEPKMQLLEPTDYWLFRPVKFLADSLIDGLCFSLPPGDHCESFLPCFTKSSDSQRLYPRAAHITALLPVLSPSIFLYICYYLLTALTWQTASLLRSDSRGPCSLWSCTSEVLLWNDSGLSLWMYSDLVRLEQLIRNRESLRFSMETGCGRGGLFLLLKSWTNSFVVRMWSTQQPMQLLYTCSLHASSCHVWSYLTSSICILGGMTRNYQSLLDLLCIFCAYSLVHV